MSGSLDDALRDEIRAERTDTLAGPESAEGRELAATIGASLHTHRTARGLSIDRLAERTALDPADVARIEKGEALPSLRIVWALATAVEVPFSALLQRPDAPRGGFLVQRAGTGRLIVSDGGRFRSRPLVTSGHARAPEVYELTLAPGCRENADAHAPGTFEHMTVVRGTLVVRAGDQETRLEAGDALFFAADVPHGYANPGDADTVVHLVMTYAARS